MAIKFTPEQATNILASKNISPEEVKSLLASKPLKQVALDYKISHVRLSACAHALDLYSKSKKEKISETLIKNQSDKVEQLEKEVNIDFVLQELQNKMPSRVSRETKISIDTLHKLCEKNNIVPLSEKDIRDKSNKNRKADTDDRLLKEHGDELLSLLKDNNSLNKISSMLPYSKRTIARVGKKIYPEYFQEEASLLRKQKRNHDNIQLNGDKKAIADSLLYSQVEQKFGIKGLEDYVYIKLNSYLQLSNDLHISPVRAKNVLENVLNVSLDLETNSLLNRGKSFLDKDIDLSSNKYKWSEYFLETFELEVPPLFSKYPILYTLNLVENSKVYMDWLISYISPSDKTEFASVLPGYNLTKVILLLQKLYPENLTKIVDKNGKERHVFHLENDPIPSQNRISVKNKKENLQHYFSSEEGKIKIAQAIEECDTQSDFWSYLGLSYNEGYFLKEQNIIKDLRFLFSSHEKKIKDFLDNNKIVYEAHAYGLLENKRKEIDFYIPHLNLGIEVNPTHTHNSTYGWGYKKENAISKNYHADKLKLACKAGISLIMLYEKDLTEPNWSNITLPFLRFKFFGAENVFYGRNVLIEQAKTVDEIKNLRSFIEKYHSQGVSKANYYYSFKDKKTGSLLGVCSFVENKHIQKDTIQIELKRMVFLPGTQIRFALSKMVKKFFDDFGEKYSSLYSYSKNDMGTGQVYEKTGFEFIRETGPGLMYVNPRDPYDYYSWSINSTWSATSGLLARHFNEDELQMHSRQELITQFLPRRKGNGLGYVEVYNSGNKLWKIDNRNIIN